MSKHTPGPWEIDKQDIFGRSETGGRMFVCTWSTKKANACLIASAPELLDALKLARLGLEEMIEGGRCGETFVAAALTLDKINAAIAKAEGAL